MDGFEVGEERGASQGRHAKASPDMSRRPVIVVVPSFTPLSRWNPVGRQASIVAVGAGWWFVSSCCFLSRGRRGGRCGIVFRKGYVVYEQRM